MFQLNNPQINKKILFTNLIELKESLVNKFLKEVEEPYIELYSIAHGWVLFERLIYKDVIKNHNMRIYLSACVRISVKLYELFGGYEAYKEKMENLNEDLANFIEEGEKKKNFHGHDNEEDEEIKVSQYEMRVMIALHFEPRVPPMLVWPHIESIQVMCDKTLEDFLGSEHYKCYRDRIKVKV